MQALAREDEDGAPPPSMLLGDFNMLRRRTRASAILDQRFPTCVRIPTYPVRRPQLSLDRIYLSPQWEVADARVLDHGAALQASDHLPLVAGAPIAASHDLPILMRPPEGVIFCTCLVVSTAPRAAGAEPAGCWKSVA